ncbi:hypothetical protein AB3464_21605 [Pseudomonas asplenii]|nr:hypothetical protein [Pseudomonas asplenii]
MTCYGIGRKAVLQQLFQAEFAVEQRAWRRSGGVDPWLASLHAGDDL